MSKKFIPKLRESKESGDIYCFIHPTKAIVIRSLFHPIGILRESLYQYDMDCWITLTAEK